MYSAQRKGAKAAPPMLAIASALMLAGYGHTAQAVIAIPSTCNYCSHVTDSVTDNGGGSWTYDFTVHNDTVPSSVYVDNGYGGTYNIDTSQYITSWDLPFFADAGITNIQPDSAAWTYKIETIGVADPVSWVNWNGVADWQTPGDSMYQGPTSPFTTATQVLHWYINDSSPIAPQSSLGGFSFDAAYGSTAAPYQAAWNEIIKTGDPAFPGGSFHIPASPNAVSSVPLPAPLLLFMSALLPLFGFSRRNRKQ